MKTHPKIVTIFTLNLFLAQITVLDYPMALSHFALAPKSTVQEESKVDIVQENTGLAQKTKLRLKWRQAAMAIFLLTNTFISDLPSLQKPTDSIFQAQEKKDEKVGAGISVDGLVWPTAFDRVSVKDLFQMLNWVPNSRFKTMFNSIYEWYYETHPNVNKPNFYEEVQNKSTKDFQKLLLDYQNSLSEEQRARSPVTTRIQEVERILADERFARELQWLESGLFQRQPPKFPFAEVYLILNQAPLDRQRTLDVLHTPEFAAFHRFLRDSFGINPNDRLINTIDNYLNPLAHKFLHSPMTQEAFSLFKKYFQDPNLTNLQDIYLVKFLFPVRESEGMKPEERAEFEAKIRRRSEQLKRLLEIYDVTTSSWGYAQFLRTSESEVEDLLSPRAQALYSYLKERYPEKLNYEGWGLSDLFGPSSFHWDMIQPLGSLGSDMTPGILDEFLEIFDLNLAKVEFVIPSPSVLKKLNTMGKSYAEYFQELSRDPMLKRFVDEMYQRYPKLKELANRFYNSITGGEMLVALVNAYENMSAFVRLNEILGWFGPLDIDIPEFDVSQLVYTKMEILEAIKTRGWKLTMSSSFGGSALYKKLFDVYENDAEKLDELLMLIKHYQNDDIAGRLYESLLREWNISDIPLNDFVRLLLIPEEQTFFLDRENSRKFSELVRNYRLLSFNAQSGKKQTRLMLRDVLPRAREIVGHYDLLTQPKIYEFITTYVAPLRMEEADDGTRGFWLLDFSSISSSEPLQDAALSNYVQQLKQMGLEPMEIGNFLWWRFWSEGIPEQVANRLKETKTLEAFEKTKARYHNLYPGKEISNLLFLEIVLNTPLDIDDTLNVLEPLSRLGFDMADPGTVYSAIKRLFSEEAVVGHLKDPQFLKFYKEIRQYFYGGIDDINSIPEFSGLFTAISRDEENRLKVLFSMRFQDVLSFVREEFGVAELHPSTLVPLLKVAEGFDREAMSELINRLKAQGERITANDIVFLSEILRDSALKGHLFDRATLLDKAGKKLATRPALFRQEVEQVRLLEAKLQDAKTMGKDTTELESQITKIRESYTERPDLNKLSNLQLLRLVLIQDALERPNTLQTLGSIVARDLKDKKTEYGGEVNIGNGQVFFDEVKSHSEFDGAYVSPKYHFLIRGIATFHLHATEVDSSIYSGPSGWVGYFAGGDIPFVDFYEMTDLIITPLGYPLDDKGSPDLTRMRLNVDFYYVDKRDPDPTKKEALIVDLGEIIVPLDVSQSGNEQESLPYKGLHKEQGTDTGRHLEESAPSKLENVLHSSL